MDDQKYLEARSTGAWSGGDELSGDKAFTQKNKKTKNEFSRSVKPRKNTEIFALQAMKYAITEKDTGKNEAVLYPIFVWFGLRLRSANYIHTVMILGNLYGARRA